MFKPPLSKVMESSIDESLFPEIDLTILVGSEDWQSLYGPILEYNDEAVQGNLVIADGRGPADLGRGKLWLMY